MPQTLVIEPPMAHSADHSSPLAAILTARALMATDRTAALAQLNDLFRSGTVPHHLDGPHRGLLVTTTFAPGLDSLIGAWSRRYLRWQGKRFTPTGGDNLWRRYRGAGDTIFWKCNDLLRWEAVKESADTYRAFPFRTTTGPGVVDPDRVVLKILYESRPNPFPVRQVLDELVDLGDGVYLGKAHGRRPGGWRLCAYFALIGGVDGRQ